MLGPPPPVPSPGAGLEGPLAGQAGQGSCLQLEVLMFDAREERDGHGGGHDVGRRGRLQLVAGALRLRAGVFDHGGLRVTVGRADLEHQVRPFLHDVLDLQEARRVHHHQLLARRHGQLPGVAEGEDLLEASGRDGTRQLKGIFAVPTEQVSEVEAAGGQDCPVRLEGLALHHDGDIAVQPQQPLLVQAAQHSVPEVGNLYVQHLRHGSGSAGAPQTFNAGISKVGHI